MCGSISATRVKVAYLSLQITTHIVAFWQPQTITLRSRKGSFSDKEVVLVGALQHQLLANKNTESHSSTTQFVFPEQLVFSAMPFQTRSCQLSRKPTQTIGIMLVHIADEMTQSEVHVIQNPWGNNKTTHQPLLHKPLWPASYSFSLVIIILDSITHQTVGCRLQRIFPPLRIVKVTLR